MKKVIYKTLIAIFFILLLQIIISSKIYGVEFDVLNSANEKIDSIKCENGKSITLKIAVKYNQFFNDPYAEWDGDGTYIKTNGYTETKIDGYDWCVEAYFNTVQAGNGKITITVNSKFWGAKVDEKTIEIPVTIQKSSEEREREKLENFCYNNNVNDITTAADQLMYLRSVIYNDSKNNNNSLWTTFVSSTTPEKRKEWYKNITYNIRNSTSETQTVETKLQAQIDIDSAQTEKEKETAQKNFDNASNNAAKAQEDAYRKIVSQLKKGESTPRGNVTFVDVLQNVDSYIPNDTVTGSDAQKITEKASFILTIITNVGIVLAVLMSAILGIKYMLGSLEERAEYKKDLVPYFIGSILLFGVCTIVKVLQTLGQSINNI